MSIQSNINQTTSLFGLMLSQTEFAKTQTAKRKLNKEISSREAIHAGALGGVKEQLSGAGGAMSGAELLEGDIHDLAVADEQELRLAELYGEKAKLDPSVKNIEEYGAREAGAAMTRGHMADREGTMYSLSDSGAITMSPRKKQEEMANKASDALAAEQARINNSRMLDLSTLDERTVERVERSYKKAQHDSHYLRKNNPKEGSK